MADGVPAPPPRETAFYVVLALVFLITVSSLGLALLKSSQRTAYVNSELAQLQALLPKGEPTQIQRDQYGEFKNHLDKEENNQQNMITILIGVFQAGTGAILGLLTGRAASK